MTAPKNNAKENKPPVHLLPLDLIIKYVTPAYQEGLVKYFRESWRLGFPVSVMASAALRHITKCIWCGEDWDPDTEALYDSKSVEDLEFIRPPKKHHLGAAIFSLLCILQTLEEHPELDDRPCKVRPHG